MREQEWVNAWIPNLRERIQVVALREGPLGVEAGRKLPYTFEVLDYEGTEPRRKSIRPYQTDVLIYDDLGGNVWVPRVVIECKLEAVTTHDALTYSAKASTHKHVQPYLRYGILLGSWGTTSLPARLVRHGGHFDFMATWARAEASNDEWQDLMEC